MVETVETVVNYFSWILCALLENHTKQSQNIVPVRPTGLRMLAGITKDAGKI